MPHLILHISPELAAQNWQPFFVKAHKILSAYADINICKSRINLVSNVYIGDGAPGQALIMFEVTLRPRPEDVIKAIGDSLFATLNAESEIALKAAGLQADPTMEIRILNHYWQKTN